MRNPFRLLGLIFRSRRPSRITQMQAVSDGFWLRRGFAAMTFFGFIVTRTQQEADRINSHASSLKRHETIHLRQAQATHDSWLCFYILYLWYCARAWHLNLRHPGAAYRLNPFEMEAYEHMHDPHYLEQCQQGANGWRKYAKMKPKERLELSKS